MRDIRTLAAPRPAGQLAWPFWLDRRFKPANVLNEGLATNDRKQYSFFVRN
jgi:hypothetical protein